MPKEVEAKLAKEYGAKNPIIYATMNKLGLMHGNKETEKGKKIDQIKKKALKNAKN